MSCLPQCSIVTLTQPAQNVLSTAVASSYYRVQCICGASERLRNVLKGSADPVTKHLRMCVSALHRCQLHRKVSAPQLPVT